MRRFLIEYRFVILILAAIVGRDLARTVGGLVLEVKGDFSAHVRQLLERYRRGDDYIEDSLTSPYRYNPLRDDLDAYALAYLSDLARKVLETVPRSDKSVWVFPKSLIGDYNHVGRRIAQGTRATIITEAKTIPMVATRPTSAARTFDARRRA